MNLRRTLIVIASALALTILSACREKQAVTEKSVAVTERSVAVTEKPIAVYVQPGRTLDGYAEPGQKLEWHVDNAQSPGFTFTPQTGLCDPATIQPKAKFHHPASCVVAQQPPLPSGVLFNTYTYTLQLDPTPGAPTPAPTTYSQRVGSCGPCP